MEFGAECGCKFRPNMPKIITCIKITIYGLWLTCWVSFCKLLLVNFFFKKKNHGCLFESLIGFVVDSLLVDLGMFCVFISIFFGLFWYWG